MKQFLKRDWTLPFAGAISGMAFFAAFMEWLDWHGYFISPDAIYLNILAKSFWSHPYTIWFKRAYSYPFEIIHPDFNFPPLGPLMHWTLEQLGIHTWHRGNWMTAFFMAAIVPAWMWAVAPHLAPEGQAQTAKSAKAVKSPKGQRQKKWHWNWRYSVIIAGLLASLLLFSMAKNQLWEELYLGIVSSTAVFFFLLSYGAYMRKRYIACGTLTGVAFLVRFDAQVTLAIFVFGHIIANWDLKRWKFVAKDCLEMGLSFLVVTSPWWIRSMVLGHAPWFNHMVPIFLYGEAGNFRWFPDTDTALGHPITTLAPLKFYIQLVRARWSDLLTPYFGNELTAAYVPEFLLLGSVYYAWKRPKLRALVAFVLLSAVIRVLVVAGLHDAFNRRYFLIVDAFALTWLILLLWDPNRLIRFLAVFIGIMTVVSNWEALNNVAGNSMRMYGSYIDSSAQADAITELDTDRAPVVVGQIEGHTAAYYTDQIPIIEIPTNYADPGMMDLYLDRFKIRYTSDFPKIKDYVKRHKFTELTARNGVRLWRIE